MGAAHAQFAALSPNALHHPCESGNDIVGCRNVSLRVEGRDVIRSERRNRTPGWRLLLAPPWACRRRGRQRRPWWDRL